MKLFYHLSDAARERLFVETGRDVGRDQAVEVDPAELRKDDRALLLVIDPHWSGRATLTLPIWQRGYAHSKPFVLDAVLDNGADLIARYRAAREDALTLVAAAREEAIDTQIARYRAWASEREPNYSTFAEYADSPRLDELKAAFAQAVARAKDLARQLTEQRGREAEAKAAETTRREAERAAWAREHGSAHLKKCVEMDYDCQRMYVLERAAIEHPGYVVDYNDVAAWRPRSGPSEAALDEAARSGGEVVWLTREPSHAVAEPDEEGDWEEPFQACEAVVIRGYLGKYDLVKIV